MFNKTYAPCLFLALALLLTAGAGIGAARPADDPFADLEQARPDGAASGLAGADRVVAARPVPRVETTLKKEIMLQYTVDPRRGGVDGGYARHSLGFDWLARFANARASIGRMNLQGRLVLRDRFLPVLNDREGMERDGLRAEYHNLYLDRYNALDPLLPPDARARHLGRFNLRAGRFYVPLGLNLATDTHATIMQLSNERDLGFERDWYAGFYGALSARLNYDLYAMLGSGYRPERRGQRGMIGGRLSLGGRALYEQGLEGGVSLLAGERLSPHALMRSASVARLADGDAISTLRLGLDGRKTWAVRGGTLALAAELSAGRDEADPIVGRLVQLDHLRASRRIGGSLQYRDFRQGVRDTPAAPRMNRRERSVAGELALYRRNDVTGAFLESIRLHIERDLAAIAGPKAVRGTLQLYRYW